MIFTELIAHSSRIFQKDHHRKVKRLRKNHNEQQQQQQQQHFLSVIPTSDLSKSISNNSITFASVFDELENNTNQTNLDLGVSIEDVDLVIVVPDKYVKNEPINIEPYPFRSEAFPRFHSSVNITNLSDPKRRSFHRLFCSHRPKKLRHPIKTTTPERSKSVPNIFFSISTVPTTNNQHQSSKTFRQWFKSSSFGRLFQSFIKHPSSNKTTKHSRVKPTISQKHSDLIY